MTALDRDPRRRGLQWDLGGWFGGQIGGSLWMGIAAAVLLAQGAALLGTFVLALFAAVNWIGWALWSRRERMRPLPAIQILLAVLCVASFATLIPIHLAGRWESIQLGSDVSPLAMYLLLAVLFPALFLQMRAIDRRGRSPE